MARDTMASFLSGAKGKCFKMVSASEHGIELNNMYNFVCSYYRKDLKKGNAVSTLFIFEEMIIAEAAGRDLLYELQHTTIPSPPGFSHEGILEMRIVELAAAASLIAQKQLKSAELKEQRKLEKLRSDAAKADLAIKVSLLSEEEQSLRAESILEGKRIAFKAIDAQAEASSDSGDEPESESETSPQPIVSSELSVSVNQSSDDPSHLTSSDGSARQQQSEKHAKRSGDGSSRSSSSSGLAQQQQSEKHSGNNCPALICLRF